MLLSSRSTCDGPYLLYCCTVVLLCCCTVVLLCCCTVVLLYCCTVVLLYCCAVVLLCCCTVVLLYCPQDNLLLKLSMFRRKLPYSHVNYKTRGFPKYYNTPDKIDRFSSNCLRIVSLYSLSNHALKTRLFRHH
jgi:hypothetical protein